MHNLNFVGHQPFIYPMGKNTIINPNEQLSQHPYNNTEKKCFYQHPNLFF